MSNETNSTGIITEDVAEAMNNLGIAQPMETEVSEAPKTLAELKEQLKNKRNLDTGFEHTDFDISNGIDMVMELDKFTKISVLNSIKFFLNMQCIRQAVRLMPAEIDRTVEGRDEYDQTIAKVMDDYEAEGDFAPSLPAFIALNDHLRSVMYNDMLEPSTMEDTLKYLTRDKPIAGNFEKDYEERVRQGQRPGISKREFCELQLQDALKSHDDLVERGQNAIQFCEDLNVTQDRGWGDLPDWAVDTIYNKFTDKLAARWAKIDIRRTALRTRPNDRVEAQADQDLIEFVYEKLTGNKFATEY
jgi:hypothetical protein